MDGFLNAETICVLVDLMQSRCTLFWICVGGLATLTVRYDLLLERDVVFEFVTAPDYNNSGRCPFMVRGRYFTWKDATESKSEDGHSHCKIEF